MSYFAWQGMKAGVASKGDIEADSLEEARAMLSGQGVMVTHLEPSKKRSKAGYKAGKIKTRDLMMFSKKFATMVEAGLPILKTMQMLRDQAENKDFQTVISMILKDVESGSSLSDAFAKHPKVFDTIYINLLRAGEESGKLTTFLKRLVVHLEKIQKIRSKLKSALMYPIILSIVAIAVIAIMLVKVVPVFQKMFASMGNSLPGPTQLIVNVSEFVRDPAQGGLIAAGLVGSVVGLRWLVKNNAKAKRKFDTLLLKIPVLGDVIKLSILSKIAMVEGNLSAAGVSVLETLDIIKSTLSHSLYREAMDDVRKGIAEGKTLSQLYMSSSLFPPTFTQMIAVGEETGNMDDMFTAVAHYYEEEFDITVDRLTELLEPIMIVFMGITVGFIIVAMYMPIFQIGKAAGH